MIPCLYSNGNNKERLGEYAANVISLIDCSDSIEIYTDYINYYMYSYPYIRSSLIPNIVLRSLFKRKLEEIIDYVLLLLSPAKLYMRFYRLIDDFELEAFYEILFDCLGNYFAKNKEASLDGKQVSSMLSNAIMDIANYYTGNHKELLDSANYALGEIGDSVSEEFLIAHLDSVLYVEKYDYHSSEIDYEPNYDLVCRSVYALGKIINPKIAEVFCMRYKRYRSEYDQMEDMYFSIERVIMEQDIRSVLHALIGCIENYKKRKQEDKALQNALLFIYNVMFMRDVKKLEKSIIKSAIMCVESVRDVEIIKKYYISCDDKQETKVPIADCILSKLHELLRNGLDDIEDNEESEFSD
jgi:hypothetical protein